MLSSLTRGTTNQSENPSTLKVDSRNTLEVSWTLPEDGLPSEADASKMLQLADLLRVSLRPLEHFLRSEVKARSYSLTFVLHRNLETQWALGLSQDSTSEET
jgi:hypothetical protein